MDFLTDDTFILSTAIGVLGVTGQLLAALRSNAVPGWAISVAIQPLWYWFYISTGGYGLLPLSTFYLLAGVLHLRKELRRQAPVNRIVHRRPRRRTAVPRCYRMVLPAHPYGVPAT